MSYFLSSTPAELLQIILLFVLSNMALAIGFIVAHFFFNQFSITFRSITPEHKKWYVIANLSKTLCLLLMVMDWRWIEGAYRVIFFKDYLNPLFLKRTSMLYVLTDSVALFMVPKLPQSTIIHHYIAVFLAFQTWAWDLQRDTLVVHLIMVYGAFSTLSYLVNTFLAMRVWCLFKDNVLNLICGMALVIYLVSCVGNWSYHLWWFVTEGIVGRKLTLEALLYCGCLVFCNSRRYYPNPVVVDSSCHKHCISIFGSCDQTIRSLCSQRSILD